VTAPPEAVVAPQAPTPVPDPQPAPAPTPEPAAPLTEEERYAASAAEARRRREESRKKRSQRPLALLAAPVAVALMVIGSLGPWSKSLLVVDNGIERTGYVVIAAGLIAAALLFAHARYQRSSAFPLVAALLATVAVTVLASTFRDLVDDTDLGPAWGLYVAFVGSAALVACSMSLLTKR